MNKTLKYFSFFGILLCYLNSCSDSTNPYYADHNRLVMIGDSIVWQQADYDDSHWKTYVEVTGKGIYYSRMGFTITQAQAARKNQGILVGCAGSFEAYWDGTYIGTNTEGVIGELPEIPGDYISYFPLADTMISEGQHVLSLRSFKTISPPWQHSYVIMDDYEELLTGPIRASLVMFMLAGAYLLATIYFFFLFINQRKDFSPLIFSVICLLFAVLVLMEYYKSVMPYPYPFQTTRLEIIGFAHLALSLLVPWFLMLQFEFPWKKILLGLGLMVILLIKFSGNDSYDDIARYHNMLMEILSFIIVSYACWKKNKGAYIVLAAFLSSLVLTFLVPRIRFAYVSHFDVMLFISFTLIMLSLLYVYSIRRKEERLAFEASLVLSERLKNELLKKNIKPHFIMNTLTSMIDWVEESPNEGVKFIEALAGEFEVLNDIADHQLIPIEQEIKLCKSHLEVMGYRKEIQYEWTDAGIDPNEIIPPAIIHTALENGVTHSLPQENGKIRFHLSFKKKKKGKEYILESFAKIREYNDRPEIKEGTGMKYIKSRLEESYPQKWDLISERTWHGWRVFIEILE